jgi:HlyD family secretion protein
VSLASFDDLAVVPHHGHRRRYRVADVSSNHGVIPAMISLTTRESRGPVRSGLVPLATIALIGACSACYFILTREVRPTWEGLPSAVVRRASFDICLTANGVAQSSQQTVVRCKLENLRIRKRGGAFLVGGASTIIDIIPNGTTVKKGDVLCRLDASEYEDVANAQALRVLQHQAEMVQTDLALQAAETALREYRDGLLPQDILGMMGRIALADSGVKAASDRLSWSEGMAAKGYASRAQVANDRQAHLGATLRLSQAQAELDTYRRFNAPKTLVALRAEVEKARKWAIHEAGDYDKSKVQLANYRSLIDRCTIRAPHDGFVIYANGPFRDEEEQFRIELGASVRQGQELFYFPDLSKMEVMALLNETVVARVRAGMPARVRFEGSREGAHEGHVESVESLPRWSYSDVRYYPCRIALDVTPRGLLPNKSAEVEIEVGRCRDVLAIPGEAVDVDHDRHTCYVVGPSGLERREITPGGSTPDLIEVADGLKEGESVVLNPGRVLGWTAGRADPASPDQPETAAIAVLR